MHNHWLITMTTGNRAAVWSRNKLMIGACIGAYLTNVSFLIRSKGTSHFSTRASLHLPSLSRYHPSERKYPPFFRQSSLGWQVKGSWADQLGVCVFDGSESRDNIMVTFFSEVFLLVVTMVGLVRERDHNLGRLLFNQVATSKYVSSLSYN